MNFPPENPNYLDQIRNMLQQRAATSLLPPGMPSLDSYHHPDPRTSLAKLVRAGAGATSVIQAAPPHHHRFSSSSPEKMASLSPHIVYDDVTDSRRSSYDDVINGDRRRDSLQESLNSSGSTGNSSNISPASADTSAGNDDNAESPPAKVPIAHTALSPILEDEEQDDGMPPGSPKSEAGSSDMGHESNCSELDFDAKMHNGSYSQLLQKQLLNNHGRKGSILQYCLTAPQSSNGGGSDAEAEHSSTSPGSSDILEETVPGQQLNCQFCDFTSSSRFHFNSHMNTHCVHRCPVPECNYSTRTEGRLRRHVKNHHNPAKDSNGEDIHDEFDDPKDKKMSEGGAGGGLGSNGKNKSYRCKQCHDFVATNKMEYYDHQRMHIKPEKLLSCPLEGCRFVTEYKHHLEYHVRNHSGSKPFKCPNSNCNYTCVNKSMLNSHMKSHSNFYQFRCECGYATKYCHSLKLHLKKYQHKATNNGPESAQLSMAASPQPTQIPTPSPKMENNEKPIKRRRNVNRNNGQAQHIVANNGNGGFPGFQMPGPGVSMVDGTPVSMPQGFPYGMYSGVGQLSQFHAASIYNNLLLSAAAAGGLMNPMNRFATGRHPAESPEPVVKRESPALSESESQHEPHQGHEVHDFMGRKQNGVLRMLPQSRVIRSVGEVAPVNGALDLSGGKENGNDRHSDSPKSDASSGGNAMEVSSSSRRRRKGPAFKLDLAVRQRLQDTVTEEDESEGVNVNGFPGRDLTESDVNCPVVQPQSPPEAFHNASAYNIKDESSRRPSLPSKATAGVNGSSKRQQPVVEPLTHVNGGPKRTKREFVCDYCGMAFDDSTMYSMHMGFHGRDDPYTCGLCGHTAADKIAFFLHIAKAPHF